MALDIAGQTRKMAGLRGARRRMNASKRTGSTRALH